LTSSGAWRQGAGMDAPLLQLGQSDAADPSEAQPRRGWASVPARSKPRQPATLIIKDSSTNEDGYDIVSAYEKLPEAL
jgi:hypothetical protein